MKKTEPALWGADRKVCDDAAQYPEYTLGRILSQEKDLYRMITAEGEYLAKVSGKFRYQAAHPSDFPGSRRFCDGGENRGRNPGSDPSGTSKKERVHAKSGRQRPKGTVSCHEH